MRKALILTLMIFMLLTLVAESKERYPEVKRFTDLTIWDFYVPPLPHQCRPKPEIPAVYAEMEDIWRRMDMVHIEVQDLVIDESLGRYMVTAYCNGKCCCGIYANGRTASGTVCHRASEENRRREPTTCAIDRRYHSFSDLIYVPSEDRVYIAEDTGSGVKGKWCDTYHDSHNDVVSYNTRKEELYACHYEYYKVKASAYDIHRIYRQEINPYDERRGYQYIEGIKTIKTAETFRKEITGGNGYGN